MEMQKVNSVLLLVLCILVVACFLMGCVEKSVGNTKAVSTTVQKVPDMFTIYGYQNVPGVGDVTVIHYDQGNVTLFVTYDGITAIPDYELNRPKDYSIVQEALESTKIKG
ncbi:MAG: hypothetical protein PHN69_03570 [Candidatus Pacebacteria bacterium]|nr:hypothetical protein [Fermentimonas sp.]MDD4804229.1 hypothetical protein [Candidatus Paceibacterota bacterium]